MLYFDPTPVNFTLLLVLALGVWAVQSASKQRADVNVPLVFYAVILIFNRMADKGLNVPLILAGIVLASLVRFEFLSKFFIKWISYLQIAVLVLILWNGLGAIFGPSLALRI
jgi:hydrogenase/urease accessory protein HupE